MSRPVYILGINCSTELKPSSHAPNAGFCGQRGCSDATPRISA